MNKCILVKNIFKNYKLGNATIHALRNVNLTIQKGELIAVVGPSGSGKTTLLNLLGTLDTPTSGEIEIDGVIVTNLSPDKLAKFRAKKIGFIFQNFNLIPVLTAFENVEFPLLGRQLNHAQRKEKVLKLLDAVGLKDFASHKPNNLSGGQQQRVAIARALVSDPTIILADEPTGNLDTSTGSEIMSLIHNINKKEGTTVIIATHDQNILEYANRIIRLKDGEIWEEINN